MITIFTPTYNRAYCISNLYESLKRQTCKDFEWIVIDDGSTDDTSQIFDQWIKEEKDFDIIYAKTKNKGKMPAVNMGVKLSTAPFFFIADSDDYLVDDAVEVLMLWAKEVQNDNAFAGISGMKRIKTINVKHDFDYIDATNLERRKYNLTMDMAECYKTDILRTYPSPEIEGENYLSPSIVWNKIAKDGYKIRWHNRVIYIAEYRTDGLSKSGFNKFIKNPIGWGKLIQLNIDCKNDEKYSEFQYYLYYKVMKETLQMEQICQYLAIDRNYLRKITDKKPWVITEMNRFFKDKNIKHVALYGLGLEAQRFLKILDDLEIEISYGIDRCPNSLLERCYKPTDVLPKVDTILITNLNGSSGIKADLKKYTDMKCISIQEDILEKGFRYYFADI